MRKSVFISLISASILGLVKIFSIVPFNRMAADDFSYAVVAKNLGFWSAQTYWYTNWTGRFVSTFLQIFFAAITGSNAKIYFYSTLTFGLVFAAFLMLFYRLIKTDFKNAAIYLMAGVSTVLLYFLTPNKTESWYWMTGSITYLWPIIFYLFGVSFIFMQKHKLTDLFIADLLIFLSIGGNETFGLLAVISLIYLTLRNRNKFNILLLISSLISFAIVFLAPGNGLRANGSEGVPMNIFGSILYSLQEGPQHLFSLMGGSLIYLVPTVILFAYIFSDQIIKENIETLLKRIFEIIIIATFLSIFYMLPAFKTLGRIPPDRTDISLALVILISLIGISFYLGKIIYLAKSEKYLLFKLFIVGASIMFYFVSFGFVRTLASDFYIAKNYSQAYDSMIGLFKEKVAIHDKKDILVSLPDPGLIAVTLDPTGHVWYKNKALSDYYGLGLIITK